MTFAWRTSRIARMRQQMIKSDGAVACDATFTFGLFDMGRRRLIDPTPEWAHAVGVAPAETRAP